MKKILFLLMSLLFLFSGCQKYNQEKLDINLYFSDKDVMYLEKEERKIDAPENIYKAIVEQVIKGPYNKMLNPTIEGDVKVFSANVEDGICILDLSKEFSIYNTGGSTKEIMALMSIVHSLCELPEVTGVKFMIEGKENPEFGGHFSLDEPFIPQDNLVK